MPLQAYIVTLYVYFTTQIFNHLPSPPPPILKPLYLLPPILKPLYLLPPILKPLYLLPHILKPLYLLSPILKPISLSPPVFDPQILFLKPTPYPLSSTIFCVLPLHQFPPAPPLLYSAAKCLWITLISQFGHFDLFLKHTQAPPGIHWILRGIIHFSRFYSSLVQDYILLQVLQFTSSRLYTSPGSIVHQFKIIQFYMVLQFTSSRFYSTSCSIIHQIKILQLFRFYSSLVQDYLVLQVLQVTSLRLYSSPGSIDHQFRSIQFSSLLVQEYTVLQFTSLGLYSSLVHQFRGGRIFIQFSFYTFIKSL